MTNQSELDELDEIINAILTRIVLAFGADDKSLIPKIKSDARKGVEAYITATHDQQLLEAILEGIVDADDTRGDTQNGNNPKYWTRRTKVINERNEEIRQHIKSVFNKEGE